MISPLSVARHNPVWEWWRSHAIATVDHRAVIEKVGGEAGWSGRFAFMTLMSAGIAILGLLLSSPAVVIGAMLISPLMGPIIGLGFGLATSNGGDIRRAAIALGISVILAVLFCALLVVMSPIQNVTPEIAARTRPNLFDLAVAFFSALAGSYAMIRGREGTIVGVAIATALMPPLAVIGYGLATANWTVFGGALGLFFTNLMTIALVAAIMARLYGFGSHLSSQHTLLQTLVALAVLIGLSIPLGVALGRIGWETNAQRQAREVVTSQFSDAARISQLDTYFSTRPIRVTATVLTPKFKKEAQTDASKTLSRLLGEPVTVTIEQVRVGTGAEAEATEIANAKARALAQAADRATVEMVNQLALVAGVSTDAVLVDRDNKRALVTATPLPGATLATYRTLEQRVTESVTNGWTVTLIPPAAPFTDITFDDSDDPAITQAGQIALDTAIWGSRRLKLPIGISGPKSLEDKVAEAFRQANVPTKLLPAPRGRTSKDKQVKLSWEAPEVAGSGASAD